MLFLKVNCNINTLAIGPEVYQRFDLRYPENLTIGDNTAINGDCFINALGGVSIGIYCHIAKGLTIYSHNHNYKSEEYIPYDNTELMREVIIEDAVWIGANVTILPGAKIGNGVVISAGSVVSGTIPDCAIIRGNPAKIISKRDEKVFWDLYNKGQFL